MKEMTLEQKILELFKKCGDCLLKNDKEIVLYCKIGTDEIERLRDDEMYDKIVSDIKTVFPEKTDAIPKTEVTPYGSVFLYGIPVRIVRYFNDDLAYKIRFYHECNHTQHESNIAKLRKKADMSQLQLAIQSGVSVATIRNYEQNPDAINTAQYQTLYAISQVLDCEIKDIVTSDTQRHTLEELYPDDKMNGAIEIIKEYINKENNKCIFVTGATGSGISTMTKCLLNYVQNYANRGLIISDALIVQNTHTDCKEMLSIRLKRGTNAEYIIESIMLINPNGNHVLWEYS
jgi:transcriptional regulator with XRE-family HTH domain